ncbi:geranylgeranyl pyrophosphate synthase [Actinoplanes sp. OR16]|uniref:polyprenyl synthetase family protein n=1 Tax=Actinoplanes sp. OR16 TaxID=946334 RepID=UPI000F6E5858|nr:polyprenyl synthetase family protein [Actinoplanes sp. OR16]BBH69789.1 geranylgeranyl pyrophosphate synthase [Actinoplanes sp. OR16]
MTDDFRDRIDAVLGDFLARQEPLWPGGAPYDVVGLVKRFVMAGGKRLRPAFCYWGWRGAGAPDADEVVVAAGALELFHAFALIHDDIIDGSTLRRGMPSVHEQFAVRGPRFGRNAALLCGDLCAAWAEQMFGECGLPPSAILRAHPEFSLMRTEVIAGQYLDMTTANGSVDAALTVVRMKGARYTVTRPLRIGARLAGADDALCAALTAFGDPLGEAFQLRDDVLGVFGDPAVTGKPVLDDLRDGKPTVMMALTRAAAGPVQRERMAALFGNPALDEPGARELRDIIVDTGALAGVEQLIRAGRDEALAALDAAAIPDEVRKELAELVSATVDRAR